MFGDKLQNLTLLQAQGFQTGSCVSRTRHLRLDLEQDTHTQIVSVLATIFHLMLKMTTNKHVLHSLTYDTRGSEEALGVFLQLNKGTFTRTYCIHQLLNDSTHQSSWMKVISLHSKHYILFLQHAYNAESGCLIHWSFDQDGLLFLLII